MGKWAYKYEIEYYDTFKGKTAKSAGIVIAETAKEVLQNLYDFYQDPDSKNDQINMVRIEALEFGEGNVFETETLFAKYENGVTTFVPEESL